MKILYPDDYEVYVTLKTRLATAYNRYGILRLHPDYETAESVEKRLPEYVEKLDRLKN
jgi:hypothetical protein